MSAGGPQIDGDGDGTGDVETEEQELQRRRAQEVEGERQAQDALRQLDRSDSEATPTTEPTRQTETADTGPQLDGGDDAMQQVEREQQSSTTSQPPPEEQFGEELGGDPSAGGGVEPGEPTTGPQPTTGTPEQEGVPSTPPEDTASEQQPTGPEPADVSDAQRQQAADKFETLIEEETGQDIDLTAEDVEVRGDQFVLGGSARAELSRAAARDAGIDFGERAARAEERTALAPESEAAIESGGLDIGTETLKEFEKEARREAQQGTGGISVESVERAGEQRQSIEAQLEQQIEEQTGRDVELDPGDYETVTEDGERRAQLTQAGIDKVQTQPVTEFVEERGIQPKKFVIEPGPFEGAFPGAGVIGAGVRLEEQGAIAKDVGVERDFGNIDLQVAQFGERPVTPGPGVADRPTIGTKSFETILTELGEDVDAAVEIQAPAVEAAEVRRGRAGAALRSEKQFFTGEGQQAAAAFGEATIESPALFAIGAAQLGKDVADFTVEVGETEIQELDTLFTSAGQTAINTAVVGAGKAIEAPAVTVGRLGGTLVGSAGIFAGAAAIGPRTSLAARAAIQPGEEALGFGGFAATRRIAGRPAAQRLFPDKEPLIFSEEAAIRGLRAANRRIGNAASAAARRAEIEAKSAEFKIAETKAQLESLRERTTVETRVGAMAGAIPRIEIEARTEGPELEGELEARPFAIEQETRQQVEAPSVESEGETKARQGRAETAVGVDALGEVGIGQVEAPAIDQVGIEGARGMLDVDIDQKIDIEPVELERGDTEIETEIALPPIQIERTEARRELEGRLESETENEFEVEFGGRQRDRPKRKPITDRLAEIDSQVIEYDIPTPDDISKRLERSGGVDVELDDVDVGVGDIDVDLDLD